MNIEQHVTSLEISKRLKELGVKQDSQFYWITSPWNGKSEVIYYQDREQLKDDFIDKRYNLVSAFLASELGELLPWKMEKLWIAPNDREIKDWYLEIFKHDFERKVGNADKWNVVYSEGKITYTHMASQTLPEAMGKMLIYLLENKLI